ncbi:MAG: PucR family transcriptional regulator [Clostridiales bacterium]|nr:PucR family transcriptional regulator [Clostridiales bacterium]
MPKTVKTLLKAYGEKYNIRLIGGEKGLDKAVTWAYLAEDIGNLGFLKPGELIITTGYFTREGISLFDFARELMGKSFSGLIINTGKYIAERDIPSELISLCNVRGFPLFTMPWEVQISNVMRDVCGELISEQQAEKAAEEAAGALLKGETVGNAEILERSGFPKDKTYRVALSEKNHKPNFRGSDMPKSICLSFEGYTVLVYTDTKDIKGFLNPKYPVGISSPRQGLDALAELFGEAETALNLSEVYGKSPVFYDNLGLLKLILKIPDRDFLNSYMRKKIGVLEDYDEKHSSRLTETLFYYILSGASPAETAKIMYAHRNTINYRMNKIRELLNSPLTDFEETAEILAAIYILHLSKEN